MGDEDSHGESHRSSLSPTGYQLSEMTPEEFERLKEQEKAHLRQLRELKQKHHEVQRKKSIFDALRGLSRPDIDETHDEQVGKLMQDAAMSEARLDLAMEGVPGAGAGPDDAAERAAKEAADREALRKSEAEALVRQMKGELGVLPSATDESGGPAPGRTIGRVIDDTPGADDTALPPKSIGRPRSTDS